MRFRLASLIRVVGNPRREENIMPVERNGDHRCGDTVAAAVPSGTPATCEADGRGQNRRVAGRQGDDTRALAMSPSMRRGRLAMMTL